MKINQVEELVGISKKNIRFYEDQELLRPVRDPSNGYRDYSAADVEQLQRIKLFRQMNVPCGLIRQMTQGSLSVERCMQVHMEELEKLRHSAECTQKLCELIAGRSESMAELDAAAYLDMMKEFEKGGARFMDVKKTDVKKRKAGALLAAAGSMLFMAAMVVLMLWANSQEPLPWGFLALFIAFPVISIVGIAIALAERMYELKGGEYDEACKY